MKDRRPVDNLTIEELERVLAIKKREAREGRLRRYRSSGRALNTSVQNAEPSDYAPPKRQRRIGLGNSLLTLVEVAAVAGLIYIAFDFWQEEELVYRGDQTAMFFKGKIL